MTASQFSLLHTRRFLPLFLTQFIAAFNDNVFKNAVVILITFGAGQQAGIDPRILVTAAAGIFILPFFLFSAIAGQLADRYEKSMLARRIRLAEIPVMICAAIGFYIGNYYLLMSILFLAGILAAFFGPIKYSVLPEHLDRRELIGGNALVEAGTFLAILAGTITGGIFILGDHGRMIVSGLLLFFAAASYLSSRYIPVTHGGDKNMIIDKNIFTASFNLIRFTRQERDVFLAIIGISWFWLVGFVFLAQLPVYAENILNANAAVVTLFLTAFSVGIALGSLICNRLARGEITSRFAPAGLIGMTAGILILYALTPATPAAATMDVAAFLSTPAYWPILAALISVAGFGGVYIVPLYAIMQTRCTPAHRSRTIAVNNIVNALFMVTGAVATMALLAAGFTTPQVFLAAGIGNLVMILAVRQIRLAPAS